MPWLREGDKQQQRQTPEQMRMWMEELTLALGGTVHPRNPAPV
jgi:hypothetical protein